MEEGKARSAQPERKTALFGFFRNFRSDRDFHLFLFAGLFAGIGGGINMSIFNNYLSDVYKLSENLRGFWKCREAPGLIIMLVLAA
jgi:hypothetical protein